MNGSQRVVQLVSQDPDDPLPCLTLLFAKRPADVGQDEKRVRKAALAERAPAHLPAPRSAREGRVEDAGRVLAQELAQGQLRGEPAEDSGLGLSEQPLSGAVCQAEPALLIEGEDRDVDLGHDAAQQRRRLERAQPLSPEGVGKRVDLQQRLAESVVRPPAARPDREVPLPHRGEEIGDRLERQNDAVPEAVREPEPEEDDRRGQSPAESRGEASRPQERQGHDQSGQRGREREQEDPPLVGQQPVQSRHELSDRPLLIPLLGNAAKARTVRGGGKGRCGKGRGPWRPC